MFKLFNEDNTNGKLQKEYDLANKKSKLKLVFHVGTGAGLFSELGLLLEAICFCYLNNIKFELYADDANFSGSNGWNDFFVPFCDLNHNPLNRKYNYRYSKYHRNRLGFAIPNLLNYRLFGPQKLKKEEKATYLTQDLFQEFTNPSFHSSHIKWEAFGIDGEVHMEYAKLAKLCLRYNEETKNAIIKNISLLKLPDHYFSIQIRSGDKTDELSRVNGIDFFLKQINIVKNKYNSLFVFTDDYGNVDYIRMKCPELKVFTLTKPSEKGYFNNEFNKKPWEVRKQELIKLFSIVEVCIHSDYHIGCKYTCVNTFIKSARGGVNYSEVELGQKRDNTFQNKIKRLFNK